jgi:CheY-like chemotaxis protein
MPHHNKTVHILLVEDHKADIALTRRAFRNGHVKVQLSVAFDGVEAMQFLTQQGRFADATRPDLILLDLNMPRMNGREVLKFVKNEPSLQNIPVIVLTTSNDDKDVVESYDLRANAYIVKPVDYSKFQQALDSMGDFWFNVARLSK